MPKGKLPKNIEGNGIKSGIRSSIRNDIIVSKKILDNIPYRTIDGYYDLMNNRARRAEGICYDEADT